MFERFLQRVDPWEHMALAGAAAQLGGGGGSSVQSATPSLSPAQSASDVQHQRPVDPEHGARCQTRRQTERQGEGAPATELGRSGGPAVDRRGAPVVAVSRENRSDNGCPLIIETKFGIVLKDAMVVGSL